MGRRWRKKHITTAIMLREYFIVVANSISAPFAEKNKGGLIMAEQLCWSCSKACGGSDCPWANKLQPVEGWTAKPSIVMSNYHQINTYRIIECPLYEKEKRKG